MSDVDSWSEVSSVRSVVSSGWASLSSLNPNALPFSPFDSATPSLCDDIPSVAPSVTGDWELVTPSVLCDGGADSSTSQVHGDLDEACTECTVCQELLGPNEPAVGMPHCSHVFHGSCLRLWFASGNNSCPNCRCAADPKQIVERVPLREVVLATLADGQQDLSLFVEHDRRSEYSEAASVTTARGWPRLADETRPELLSSAEWASRATARSAAAQPQQAPLSGRAACYRDAVLVNRAAPVDRASTAAPLNIAANARGPRQLSAPPTPLCPAKPRACAAQSGSSVQLVGGRLLLARSRGLHAPSVTRLASRRKLLSTIEDVEVEGYAEAPPPEELYFPNEG